MGHKNHPLQYQFVHRELFAMEGGNVQNTQAQYIRLTQVVGSNVKKINENSKMIL